MDHHAQQARLFHELIDALYPVGKMESNQELAEALDSIYRGKHRDLTDMQMAHDLLAYYGSIDIGDVSPEKQMNVGYLFSLSKPEQFSIYWKLTQAKPDFKEHLLRQDSTTQGAKRGVE